MRGNKMARGIIIDDSKFMRNIIKTTLVAGGHEIIGEADNGTDGLEMYKSLKPDFATMDITMMGKDGLETVADITKIDPHAKIVVVSAMSEKALRLNQKNINARAFITKPFDKKQLLDTINKVL
jgi:two-component system, chemotaxis family, chemotaxis protein CheY